MNVTLTLKLRAASSSKSSTSRWNMPWVILFFLSVLILLLSAPARAQGTADILGTVTDPSGGVVPHAKVTLINVGTGISQTAQSSTSGDYIFPGVLVGSYRVEVAAPGFKTFSVAPFEVSVGDRARADAKLEVGEQTTTVEVTGTMPALHTDTASLSTLITSQGVENLPLNGRNIIKLVQMTAGAGPSGGPNLTDGTSPDDRRQTSTYYVNGQNANGNSNLIDGMDNNEVLIAASAVRPSVDAIQEINISTNSYDASITKAGGGAVNVITKSGTNQFHGSAYEFFRNAVLNTNPTHQFPANYSNCSSTGCSTLELTPPQPKPPFRLNQYGASLGGPIKKNKTFFFGDFERYNQAKGIATTNTVPTLCNRGLAKCPDGQTQFGDFSDQPVISVPGGGFGSCTQDGTTCPYVVVPASKINPLGLAYLSMYPHPNGPGIVNNYTSSPMQVQKSTTFDTRIDQHFSDSNTLFVRYSFNNIDTLTPDAFPAVTLTSAQDPLISGSVTLHPGAGAPFATNGLPGPNHTREQAIAVSYSHVFSPALVLNLKVGFLRSFINSKTLNSGSKTLAEQLGFPCNSISCVNTGLPATNGIPQVTMGFLFAGVTPGGFDAIGDSVFVPILYLDNTFQYQAGLTWTKGSQTIKFGAVLIRRRNTFGQSANARGAFDFSGAYTGVPGADLLEGLADNGGIGGLRALTLVQPGLRSWEPGAYVQDDWRVTHWLTLNLGIRYDIFTPYTEKFGRIANFDPATGLMVGPAIAGPQQSGPTAGIRTDYTNVAPRFGFSASLRPTLVLRGGFGLTYFKDNVGATSSLINPPFQFGFHCQLQNLVGNNNPCNAPFGSTAVAQYGLPPSEGSSNVGQTGGPLLSAGVPAPVFNLNQVLAPASCPFGADPNSFGCTAAGGNNYASLTPGNLFMPYFPSNYLEVYNLGLEKQIGANVLSVGFVGNLGRHLHTAYDPTNIPNSNVTFNPLSLAYPWLAQTSGISLQNKWGTSSYQSMQANFTRRFNKGLTVNVSYTYAHSIADGQGTCQPIIGFSNLGYGNGPKYNFPCFYDNPKNPASPFVEPHVDAGRFNVANTPQDVRHRVVYQVNYDLPLGLKTTGVEAALIKGWSTALAGSWQTGLPFSVSNGTNVTGVGAAGNPDMVCSGQGSNHSELLGWVNASCFTLPTANTFGNAKNNAFFGPHQRSVDFSLIKTFDLNERFKLEFRTEVFNLFNTPNFAVPNATVSCYGVISGGACANAADATNRGSLFDPGNPTGLQPGTITSLASFVDYNSREIQFALKVLF